MSFMSKVLGGVVPTITFQGQPAAVEAINFDVEEGQIVVRTADRRRILVRLKIVDVAAIEG